MRRLPTMALCLLMLAALLAGGCARKTSGPDTPRQLTEGEESQVVEIALSAPEVSEWLEKSVEYRTELSWFAQTDSDWRSWGYDMDFIASIEMPPDVAFRWYPGAIVGIGSPQQRIISVIVDLDEDRAVHIVSQPDVRKESNLEWLTAGEEARVIEIALGTPEATEWLEKGSVCTTRLVWVGTWGEGSYGSLEYDVVELGVPSLSWVESAVFHPGVVIHFGDPEEWVVMVGVDLTTEEVVVVDSNPVKGGPDVPAPTR
jgi:hypothetical protein